MNTSTTAPILAGLAAVLFSTPALAGLNPWGGHTGEGTTAINPYAYVYDDGSISPTMYVLGGVTERFDIIAGVGMGFDISPQGGPAASMGALEFMPRFFVTDSVGLVLHTAYVPGDTSVMVSPAVHAIAGVGKFSFVANVGWQPSFGAGGVDTGGVYALLAPEVSLTDNFSVFTEVNPGLSTVDGTFDLTLVPGAGFVFGKDGAHSMAVGLQVGVLPDVALSGGLWYSTAWGPKTKPTIDAMAAADL